MWGRGTLKNRSTHSWEVELSLAELSDELNEPHQSCVQCIWLGTGRKYLRSRIKELEHLDSTGECQVPDEPGSVALRSAARYSMS